MKEKFENMNEGKDESNYYEGKVWEAEWKKELSQNILKENFEKLNEEKDESE